MLTDEGASNGMYQLALYDARARSTKVGPTTREFALSNLDIVTD